MGSVTQLQDDYVLGRSIESRTRLNLQHFMYRKMFGYLLHPIIPRTEGLEIADVATGTGIWLLDLISELPPSTSYHGFDVDLSQVPPSEWIPDNFSFSKLNLFEELPNDLEGVFDIVNIRMLLSVVKDNDPKSILRKTLRMLKPGGWLQWTEASHSGYLDFVKTNPQLIGTAMKALRNKIASKSDHRFQPTWPLDLPEHFRTAGFENVQGEEKNGSDFLPWLSYATDTTTTMYKELITQMDAGTERDELQHLYDQAARESRQGVAWNGTRINVVGQKPDAATEQRDA